MDGERRVRFCVVSSLHLFRRVLPLKIDVAESSGLVVLFVTGVLLRGRREAWTRTPVRATRGFRRGSCWLVECSSKQTRDLGHSDTNMRATRTACAWLSCVRLSCGFEYCTRRHAQVPTPTLPSPSPPPVSVPPLPPRLPLPPLSSKILFLRGKRTHRSVHRLCGGSNESLRSRT